MGVSLAPFRRELPEDVPGHGDVVVGDDEGADHLLLREALVRQRRQVVHVQVLVGGVGVLVGVPALGRAHAEEGGVKEAGGAGGRGSVETRKET